MDPRRSAVPLLAAARPEAAAPAPADDDFWRRVAGLATGLRTDVALLETTDPGSRRWLLVPSRTVGDSRIGAGEAESRAGKD